MITLFSSPKPFRKHIDLIQRNALASWLALGQEVEVLLLGDEDGIDQAAAGFGVRHLPIIQRNPTGTPLLNSIFGKAEEAGAGPVFCYANADILFLPDLLETVEVVAGAMDRFMLVGQRWDLDVREFLGGTADEVHEKLRIWKGQAQLHRPAGSDYFVYRGLSFAGMPPFALGRAGWDNWMIYAARAAGVPVIDATQAITVLHQDHDYEHLPGGEAHYRLPESRRNVELAGGREMIFTLRDTTWTLADGKLRPKAWNDPGVRRRLETSLYARVGSGRVARAARLLLHPIETLTYFGRRLVGALGSESDSSPEVESLRSERSPKEPDGTPMVESTAPSRSKPDEI
ncbi:MAG: hypothetical protein WBR18_03305 [Anaerolineales bacterium]